MKKLTWKMETKMIKWAIAILIILFIAMISIPPAYSSGDDCERGHEQCGHNDDGGDNVEVRTDSDANAKSESISTGGEANVHTSNESTSLVLTGARDTAECFTKVTIGAEGFGIGFSRKDPYCQKVRAVARQLRLENWDAAAKLECTLKIWKEVYGKNKKACENALYAGPEYEEPQAGIWLTDEEYDTITMAQVSQEEYTEQRQMVEDKFAKYDNLIEYQQQKLVEDDEEIDRLKQEAAELRAAEQLRNDEAAARRARARDARTKALEDEE